jgi:acetylornithine deacetylase/succinyl-diaminopimelate desuccinylase-like protein
MKTTTMRDRVRKIDRMVNWRVLPDTVRYTIEQSKAIQQIPAPTFSEHARAAYVLEQFRALHLQQTAVDAEQNVYGLLPGKQPYLPALMIAAHTDTVFPTQTDLALRQENDLMYGPGLGDNSFGVGGMLGLLYTLREQKIMPERDLWFVATSREEGLGDLGGMKAAFQQLRERVGCIINLEGLAFGHVYHAGIAVRRLHISAQTEGGHSWLHFGRPSATHAVVELGARILSIQPIQAPRTTYNIGQIEGGQGINVIASSAGLWLDMRSETAAGLHSLEQQVLEHINALQSVEVVFTVTVVGDRPAGFLSPEHELVQGALSVLAHMGVQGVLETGSTDANIPLAAGYPAVTIGITRGGNAHRLDEYVEIPVVNDGMRQLILLALTASNNI